VHRARAQIFAPKSASPKKRDEIRLEYLNGDRLRPASTAGTVFACFPSIKSVPGFGTLIVREDGAMRFHRERDKRLHLMQPSPSAAPHARNAKFVMRRAGSPAQRPTNSHCPCAPWLPQEEVIAEDSPMISACFEAYRNMQKMLTAFAELRGENPEDGAE
jgi:hypothetical protein